ncbi:MAG: hypothetical protein KDB98_11900 [Flavobacteriales bacterium]|nr:hypothetical protein [Flavobacteriales bacterium]
MPVSLSIHSTDGKIISKQRWAPELRMNGVSKGIYILSAELKDGSLAYMRVLIP